MGEYKPGPKELQLIAMREANYKRSQVAKKASVAELRQAVAKVSPKKKRKGARRARKP